MLRDDEAVLGVGRDIFDNPIRAGLVDRVDDYPFLGSTTHSVQQILEAIAVRPRC